MKQSRKSRNAKAKASANGQSKGVAEGVAVPQAAARGAPVERIARWPIGKLLPYAGNPKTHPPAHVELIARSMARFGQAQIVLVDESGEIIAGHGRVLAAQSLGWTDLIVGEAVGWTDDERRAYRIADNQLGSELLAPWDMALLKPELASLSMGGFDMAVLGFDNYQLRQFLVGDATNEATEALPNLSPTPIVRVGDLWLLDDHRLLCGDAMSAEAVARALNGRKINIGFTSPPYAEQREYDYESGFRPVSPDHYVEWFKPAAANVARHLADDGSWFINIKPSVDGLDTSLYVFDLVIAHVREWGWHFATEFCWERNGVPKSVTQRFKNQFEPIYQFARGRWKMRPDNVRHESDNVPRPGGVGSGQTSWKNEQGQPGSVTNAFGAIKKRRHGTSRFMSDQQGHNVAPGEFIGPGLAYPGNRLPTFTSSHDALGHAAAFPVGLPRFFCKAFADEGDVIFDPFCGTGSTIMAAAQAGCIGVAIELSPAYCQVSVERWQNFTGKKAILDGDGRDFDTIRAERLPAEGRLQPVDRGSVPGDPRANSKRRAAVGAEGKGRRQTSVDGPSRAEVSEDHAAE